jgi:hypothetical protein
MLEKEALCTGSSSNYPISIGLIRRLRLFYVSPEQNNLVGSTTRGVVLFHNNLRRYEMKKFLFMLFALLVFSTGGAYGYTINYQTGRPVNALSVDNHVISGGMMDGMQIVVTFADNSTESDIWSGTGVVSGSASGGDWSLSLTGNSFLSPWMFTSSVAVKGLSISAFPGDIVFDVIHQPEHTPNSDSGRPFYTINQDLDVSATYSDEVNLQGTFYKDLYATLDISFASDYTGTYQFYTDTDSVTVPTPAPIFLLGGSLSLLGLAGWRRKKA